MSEGNPVETCSWVNVTPYNRREKIARWWVENVIQQRTYLSRSEREGDFSTTIPIGEIDGLASEGLRNALREQLANRENGDSTITHPRATPDGSQYFGSIGLPTSLLGVTFTARGVVENPPLE